MSVEKQWGGLVNANAFSGISGAKDFYCPNSNTRISDDLFKPATDKSEFVIHGYKGSTAETFAIQNDLTFVDMAAPTVSAKMGDLDDDGDKEVTSADALEVLRYSVGLATTAKIG